MPKQDPEAQARVSLEYDMILAGCVSPKPVDAIVAFETARVRERGEPETSAERVARFNLRDKEALAEAIAAMREANPRDFVDAAPAGLAGRKLFDYMRNITRKRDNVASGERAVARALSRRGLGASKRSVKGD